MYALLTGTRSNVGDHLIADRSRRLLRGHRPRQELLELERWKPLDDRLDEVNRCDAVVLCGGPALQPDVHPGIYPLVADLDRIKPPIVAFGLGWKGMPGDETTLRRYRFTEASRRLLGCLARGPHPVSCRDHLTRRVLEREGVANALMTGDPAWYDLGALGRPFRAPPEIRSIVFSTAANAAYLGQTLELLRALRRAFPGAAITCAFHHGWSGRASVPARAARGFQRQQAAIERAGFATTDLAADLQAMERAYGEADLHVGYRLHAHLLCLSQRKPSFLLEEDGRGRGASEALNVPGVRCWERLVPAAAVEGARRVPLAGERLGALLDGRIRPLPGAAERMASFVAEEAASGFLRLRGVAQVIDGHYERAMKPFLEQLP